MATQDVRLELIQHEYSGARKALHDLMDRMDGYESAVLGLSEAVNQNGERIEALEQRVDVIDDKLDAIIKHLEVPYKPQAGFLKE